MFTCGSSAKVIIANYWTPTSDKIKTHLDWCREVNEEPLKYPEIGDDSKNSMRKAVPENWSSFKYDLSGFDD